MLSRSPLPPTARPVSRPGAPRLVSASSPEAGRPAIPLELQASLRRVDTSRLTFEAAAEEVEGILRRHDGFDTDRDVIGESESRAVARRERIALAAGLTILVTLAGLGIIAAALALGVL